MAVQGRAALVTPLGPLSWAAALSQCQPTQLASPGLVGQACAMSGDAENSTVAARTIGRPFAKGASGNPGGRSRTARDIQELARVHGPAAIATLAQALKSRNERVRVAAAAILLDRAYGKPVQAITTDPATSAVGMHLLAAKLVSQEILVRMEHNQPPPVIDATAEKPNGKVPVDLLSAPLPTE
jgi:hypothetical protein